MVEQPRWFAQLKWSTPMPVSAVNKDRKVIPDFPGCYVFMTVFAAPSPGRVLYVGQASTSLRQRLASYLVDYSGPTSGPGHKGKGFILEARQQKGEGGVYLQWVEYGADIDDMNILEASLINYLNPQANDRDEDARHPTLGKADQLHPGLLR